MPSAIVRGVLRLIVRLILTAVVLLAAVQLSLMLARGQGGGEAAGADALEVARAIPAGEVPPGLSILENGGGNAKPASWIDEALARAPGSLRIFGLAVLAALATGPALGTLAGRHRRLGLALEGLLSPLFAAVWLPAFWGACLVAWVQVAWWGHPGFADAPGAINDARGLEPWWRALPPAVLVTLSMLGWQVRAVSGGLKRAARAGHVRAAHAQGLAGAGLFYRHVFRNALEAPARCLDRSLPAMLGTQILVEWVLRFPGLGTLLVDSAREAQFPGMLVAGALLAAPSPVFRFLGEMLHAATDLRARRPAALAPDPVGSLT
ncbi:MAG: ABC transporter permease subunit [Akkermansiaceae bacterium]|nr:ABC transporter permease subunit [Akkermansiaceae bacterium]MCP5551483.1 ABC transporter permease subunit [Akkermansiaceae bacterium]